LTDEDDGIWRVPRNGGAAEHIHAQAAPIHHLVLDSTHVYFSQEYDVLKVPKEGGAVETVHSGQSLEHIQGLAIQSATLYWTMRSGASYDGFIYYAGVSGGAADFFDLGSGTDPIGIDVADDTIFWASRLTREVLKRPTITGMPTVLVGDLGEPEEVAVNDTHVCFSELGIVASVTRDGGDHAFLSQSGEIYGAAASASFCYFGTANGVVRAPLDMAVAVMHVEVPNVRDVRYRDGRVFFTADAPEGLVFSAAAP
jgi:hypothetical protein